MGYSEDQKYWVWLSSVYGLGARRFDALLDKCGPPQQVWEECGPHLASIIGQQAYASLSEARSAKYLDRLFADLDRCGAIAVTREDAEYPPRLREIADSPPTLFVRGRSALADDRTLAVVGARNCTAYGTRMARRLSRELSQAGVVIVSGMARGVDGAAHRGAVDAKARTVAVLGSGVDVIYPPEHLTLFEEIIANGGSVVSELRPGAPPKPQHFPARNRIISGLAEGLLFIEGAKQSGAMTTVAYALEQDRDVLALPGQADSPLSEATHALIRDGARLVTTSGHILEDMRWTYPGAPSHAERMASLPMTLTEQRIFNQLQGGPADVDALVEALGVTPKDLNSDLTFLEFKGIIRKLPGRRVEVIANLEE